MKKVIIISYLIFLQIYVIEMARSTLSYNFLLPRPTATSIPANIALLQTRPINNNSTSSNNITKTTKPIIIATANDSSSSSSSSNITTANIESKSLDENNAAIKFGLKIKILDENTTGKTKTTVGKSGVEPKLILQKNDKKRQIIPMPTKSIREYQPSSSSSSSERKKQVPKKYIPSSTIKSITQQQPSITKGPTKITLPKSIKLAPPSDTLVCPKETQAKFNLFALPCKTDADCTSWNKENRCCTLFRSRNCHRGVTKPLQEQEHKPILGLIPHKCPKNPLAELWWELKTCESDNDCWPRVCCPDGRNQYCRTSSPEYESVPFQFGRPLAYFSEYLECTPPPPPIFDLHPKACNSTFDCFPNVCCQEAGKKNCRPPKKSVLTFMASFLNTGLLKRLTNNLVIR